MLAPSSGLCQSDSLMVVYCGGNCAAVRAFERFSELYGTALMPGGPRVLAPSSGLCQPDSLMVVCCDVNGLVGLCFWGTVWNCPQAGQAARARAEQWAVSARLFDGSCVVMKIVQPKRIMPTRAYLWAGNSQGRHSI